MESKVLEASRFVVEAQADLSSVNVAEASLSRVLEDCIEACVASPAPPPLPILLLV